jgi:hypothetical protein
MGEAESRLFIFRLEIQERLQGVVVRNRIGALQLPPPAWKKYTAAIRSLKVLLAPLPVRNLA